MTCQTDWTRRELAYLLGFDRMGESIDQIAKELGRPVPDVKRGLHKALYLIGATDDLPAVWTKDGTWRVPAQQTLRAVSLLPIAPRAKPQLANCRSVDLTASLMGDPAAANAARAQLDPPKYRPEPRGNRR